MWRLTCGSSTSPRCRVEPVQMIDLSNSNHDKVQSLCWTVTVISSRQSHDDNDNKYRSLCVTCTFVQKRLLCFLHTAGGGHKWQIHNITFYKTERETKVKMKGTEEHSCLFVHKNQAIYLPFWQKITLKTTMKLKSVVFITTTQPKSEAGLALSVGFCPFTLNSC